MNNVITHLFCKIRGDSYVCVFYPFNRYNRDYVVEGEPYAGYDRHNAEVAAFHLDRCVNIITVVL